MSFLTWAALAVGLLVAVPVLAHLLRRRPPDEQPFAPSRLVPPTAAVAQRRTALEDRTLLVVRALAVLALAVLGATPFVRCSRLSLSRQAGASVALAIVLDDSLSMRAPLAGGDEDVTRFVRAVAAARELCAGLQPGDAVALVLAGKPARVALGATTNLAALPVALGSVRASDRGTDLAGAVKIAGELVANLAHVDKRVVVFSDLLGGEPGAPAIEAPAGVVLWSPVPELHGEIDDCAVVRADRSGTRVDVRVACSGPAVATRPEESSAATASRPAAASASEGEPGRGRARKRQLSVRVGDRTLVETPIDPRAPLSDVTLTLPDGALDEHAHTWLYAVLDRGDAIGSDDAAPLFSLGGELRVGVVSDPAADRLATGGAPVVEQAFRALDLGVLLRPMATVPDASHELGSIGLLIIDDVPGLTPEQRRDLGEWVERGGVMLITLGPQAAAAPLGSSFVPMLPAVVRWKATESRGLGAADDHFFGGAFDGMAELAPQGRSQLELEREPVLQVLSRWDDGAPFLLEHRMGRGVAFVTTLPLGTHQSDLALRPGFLALLERLVTTARDIAGLARAEVGTSWSVDGYSRVAAARLGRDDQVEPVAVEVLPGGRRRVVPALVGVYQLVLDGQQTEKVAMVDEQEIMERPRAIVGEQGAGKLGSTSAAVDVSAEVALGLLGLFAVELALRLAGARLRRRSA
jgi:hypothetical protein